MPYCLNKACRPSSLLNFACRAERLHVRLLEEAVTGLQPLFPEIMADFPY